MKKIVLLALTVFFFSCKKGGIENGASDEGHVRYDDQEKAQGDVWNEQQINNFITDAAMIDKMQIMLGEMAQKKAANESVGIYGKLLVDDHTYSLRNLEKIATRKKVNITDSLDNEHLMKVQNMERLQGEAFDRQFLDMMIEGHRKDIEKYENALKSIDDSKEIKAWVDDTLTSLRRHLQKAQQLKRAPNV